jgi:15-cis-phytoene synthase
VTEAAEITRRAKSNLAFALAVLPKDRRENAVVYYAFCRTLDDLADAPGMAVAERRDALEAWRHGLIDGFADPDGLQRDVLELRERTGIPVEWLTALVDGCIEDLEPQRYRTWDELGGYIWKVAGAVGLVSARIFGCVDPSVDRYAESLGQALQLTNILRDVGEDWANGRRLYLPLEVMEHAGITEYVLDCKPQGAAFRRMMERVAERAELDFAHAARLLPDADREALLPARIMAGIYQDLLRRMRDDGFRVFETRYRVPGWRKLWILTKIRFFG